MSERLCPWRSKCSQAVLDMLHQLQTTILYLVHRTGPTSFLVREDGQESKRKVVVGARPHCTCMQHGPGQPCQELCVHILFVMVKVLRVPPSNPLVWQLSLTDRELEEALRCASIPSRPPSTVDPSIDKHKKHAGVEEGVGSVVRKALDEEDPCPICYEDMCGQDLAHLVWCRNGCGSNVHGKCLSVWAEHQTKTLDKPLTCPLCRTGWGDFIWRPPPPKRKKLAKTHEELSSTVHLGTCCSACKKAPITGPLYRCLICASSDLCDTCFQAGHHSQHPFACRPTPTAFAVPAQRQELMPTAARIAPPARQETQDDALPDSQDGPPQVSVLTPPTSRQMDLGTAAMRKPPIAKMPRPVKQTGLAGLLPAISSSCVTEGLALEGQCLQGPRVSLTGGPHQEAGRGGRDLHSPASSAGMCRTRRRPQVLSPSDAAAAAALARQAAAGAPPDPARDVMGPAVDLQQAHSAFLGPGRDGLQKIAGRRHKGMHLKLAEPSPSNAVELAGMLLQGMSFGVGSCADGLPASDSGAALVCSRPSSGQGFNGQGRGMNTRMWNARSPANKELQVAMQRHGRFMRAMSLPDHRASPAKQQQAVLALDVLHGQAMFTRDAQEARPVNGSRRQVLAKGSSMSRLDRDLSGVGRGDDVGVCVRGMPVAPLDEMWSTLAGPGSQPSAAFGVGSGLHRADTAQEQVDVEGARVRLVLEAAGAGAAMSTRAAGMANRAGSAQWAQVHENPVFWG